MSFTELEIGHQIDSQRFMMFFGNRKGDLETIQKFYPHLEYSFTRQTHSSIIAVGKAPRTDHPLLVEADAQWTEKMNLALCVRTADCVPILLYSEKPEQIFAIHAGWRGVANRIFPKALSQWIKRGIDLKKIMIFIGPHLQQMSFEIDLKVRDEILKSVQTPRDDLYHQKGEKYFFSLEKTLRFQAEEFGIRPEQILSVKADTKSEDKFFSYRREPATVGRQISFIAIK